MLASIRGTASGPTLIVVGSIHGNEPAGVAAARRAAPAVEALQDRLAGEVVFLAGNTRALARGERYIDADLNRVWFDWRIDRKAPESEDCELVEIYTELVGILGRARGDVYVIDMHTTSAGGVPFVTLGDTLRNRSFATHFPVPIILGIEEQLDGTMLEFLSNRGCITLGFEAGQHVSPTSVDNHEALAWVALVAAGNLKAADVPELPRRRHDLEAAGGGLRFIEIRYRHAIRDGDDFRMLPGFANFEPIRKGQQLATDWRGPVLAVEGGMILMPLYQAKGNDGFFIARRVKAFWLKLSALLRKAHVGRMMYLLPGVRRHANDPAALIVNTRLARIFPMQVFHLLGYRKLRWDEDFLVVSRRKFD
ncbi:MAG TPA: succinylglutamate desuccinylase/aspartoacylase family protein [Blastocatellia bacterium]|nr:succinylglutamate desuccinylase/aspartoacylase family protein [Blastocatellia bacterium]